MVFLLSTLNILHFLLVLLLMTFEKVNVSWDCNFQKKYGSVGPKNCWKLRNLNLEKSMMMMLFEEIRRNNQAQNECFLKPDQFLPSSSSAIFQEKFSSGQKFCIKFQSKPNISYIWNIIPTTAAKFYLRSSTGKDYPVLILSAPNWLDGIAYPLAAWENHERSTLLFSLVWNFQKSKDNYFGKSLALFKCIKPLVPSAPFLYHLTVFCFQEVEKGCIGNKLVHKQKLSFTRWVTSSKLQIDLYIVSIASEFEIKFSCLLNGHFLKEDVSP